MKILLLDNIKGLGQVGDIKDVKDGYAKNFLLPKRLAKLATKGVEKEVAQLQEKRKRIQEQETRDAQALVERLKDFTLELNAKTDDKGSLYAGIGPKEISDALKKEKFNIDADVIMLDEPLKKTGEYNVVLEFSDEVKTDIRVVIESEK